MGAIESHLLGSDCSMLKMASLRIRTFVFKSFACCVVHEHLEMGFKPRSKSLLSVSGHSLGSRHGHVQSSPTARTRLQTSGSALVPGVRSY